VPALFLPSPVGVLAAGWDMLRTGELLTHLATRLQRIALGFGLGALGGVAVGLAVGVFSLAEAVGNPLIAATFPIPKIALLPLLILWLGIGEASKVAVITLGMFLARDPRGGVALSHPSGIMGASERP
jgi:ABC-type nitrate/sulfonate/bicarbonate transport system permease component